MTLDEYIEHFNLVVVYAKRGGEYATNFSDLDNLIDFNTGVLGYLKELKTLRVELKELEVYKKRLVDVEAENKAIRKELAVYMKALELACDDIFHSDKTCDIDCKTPSSDYKCCAECFSNDYLQKAREEE